MESRSKYDHLASNIMNQINSSGRRIASMSLDLDNQWSYMKTHGEDGWEEFPTYLDWAVPRILKFLDARNLKITFFIVGQDAALEKNREAMRAIGAAGHEVGNHSFNHEPWLHLYSSEQLDEELAKAESAIERATGQRPSGFRGPGFSLSPATLRALIDRRYKYDATVFPNLLNPLARMYFFATSSLSAEEKEKRKELFGTWKDAARPLKPFRWAVDGEFIMELPVTTMPVFKVPIHLSYVLYAARFSQTLALAYFRFALFMCRLTKVEPSILLHPLDFIGSEDIDALDFFPGMDMPLQSKLSIVNAVLDMLQEHFRIVPICEHLDACDYSLRELKLQAS
jgi:hypothetical protein